MERGQHASRSTRRGSNGAWQKFERGEIPLFTFYEQFGQDLSDTTRGNVWYREYCERRGIGTRSLPWRSLALWEVGRANVRLHLPRMS